MNKIMLQDNDYISYSDEVADKKGDDHLYICFGKSRSAM